MHTYQPICMYTSTVEFYDQGALMYRLCTSIYLCTFIQFAILMYVHTLMCSRNYAHVYYILRLLKILNTYIYQHVFNNSNI